MYDVIAYINTQIAYHKIAIFEAVLFQLSCNHDTINCDSLNVTQTELVFSFELKEIT
jgi:hypothetical protein